MNREDFKFKRQWGPTPKYDKVKNYIRKNNEFIFIAGPCSIESKEQIEEIAKIAAGEGVTHLRGGVFRAGTYLGKHFGYIEESLISAYFEAAQKNNLENIIEVLDYTPASLNFIEKYSTCFQVGSRSMQNYTLLSTLSAYDRTIFLKRNQGSNLDEFLGSAEYLLKHDIAKVVLIERGSSSFLNHVRWDLSISIIPAIKAITQIPIICDASHGTGRSDLVDAMTCAGVASGADGALIEFHTDPDKSLSDSEQAISIDQFKLLAKKINKIRGALL